MQCKGRPLCRPCFLDKIAFFFTKAIFPEMYLLLYRTGNRIYKFYSRITDDLPGIVKAELRCFMNCSGNIFTEL